MPRKSPLLHVEEISGDRYPDLATAQRLALPSLVRDLAATVQALLISGELIKSNGMVIPELTGDSSHG